MSKKRIILEFTCEHCGERFENEVDLHAHQWNNKYCPIHDPNKTYTPPPPDFKQPENSNQRSQACVAMIHAIDLNESINEQKKYSTYEQTNNRSPLG